MVLLLDNYDSFVHNLARYIGLLGYRRIVYRNDAITLAEIMNLDPTHIILSPGPGAPIQAGITLDLIAAFAGKIPILGVCLGHQAIGHAFGAQVSRASNPMHGKSASILHNGVGIFAGLANPFFAARYHSLIVTREDFPNHALEITAVSPEFEIMALQHKNYPIYGVQFHPESILTQFGSQLLRNFLSINNKEE